MNGVVPLNMGSGEEQLLLEWDGKSGPVDWRLIFGNANPVEIELGIGKGRFLIQSAQESPEKNFLGIEWVKKYLALARARALKSGLANIRFLRTDAAEFVKTAVPGASVSRYHVYFPDPWPKRKHHKRRLFQEDFIAKVADTLLPGGILTVTTDFLDYYTWIARLASQNQDIMPLDSGPVLFPGGRTHYEAKYLKEGRPIYQLIFEKKT